jgi:NAD(P)H-dependent flavin oxidoreductase YrpB (nitropropane dioxygenase family)
MALRTAFTEPFSLQHPIALAPMGDVSGGALAAAVSNGGGLGLIGGGRGDPGWVAREMEIAAGKTGAHRKDSTSRTATAHRGTSRGGPTPHGQPLAGS